MFKPVSFLIQAPGQAYRKMPRHNAGSRSANKYPNGHGTVKLDSARLFTHPVSTGLPLHSLPGFELIGAFDILEHISEDEAAIAQVYPANRPGGGIVVTVAQLCLKSCGFREVLQMCVQEDGLLYRKRGLIH